MGGPGKGFGWHHPYATHKRRRRCRRRNQYLYGDGGSGDRTVNPPPSPIQALNLSAPRALALAASCSRFFGGAFVSNECRSRAEMPAISSTASRNKHSFAFDG